MKKIVFMGICLVSTFCVFGQDLDTAIRESTDYFNNRLPQRARVAVTNFGVETYGSQSNSISEYIIDETVRHFVNSGRFSIVERQNIDAARRELNFNMSGEVSDETAQRIGRFLGAQVVLFGSLKPVGNIMRFQVRAIRVETAEILGVYTGNIQKSDITRIFGKEPKPPTEIEIEFNPTLLTDIGGGDKIGFDMNLFGLQLGVKVNNSSFILLDASCGLGSRPDKEGGLFSYHIGGLLEKRFAGVLLIGVGGGIGGGSGYEKDNTGLETSYDYNYTYIRGTISMLTAYEILKLGIYYDYNIDFGYKFGFRLIVRPFGFSD